MTEPQSTTHVPLTGRGQLTAAAARLNQAHAVTAERFPALAAARIRQTSDEVHARAESMQLTESDLRFLCGWLSSSAPAAMDEALDGLVVFRATRSER